MPHLPFNASPSPATSPKHSPPPSIVLSPASGSSSKQLYKSSEEMATAYRKRYAQYLASTFNMSIQAAMAEADIQLAPRRSSSVSEAETLRQI